MADLLSEFETFGSRRPAGGPPEAAALNPFDAATRTELETVGAYRWSGKEGDPWVDPCCFDIPISALLSESHSCSPFCVARTCPESGKLEGGVYV